MFIKSPPTIQEFISFRLIPLKTPVSFRCTVPLSSLYEAQDKRPHRTWLLLKWKGLTLRSAAMSSLLRLLSENKTTITYHGSFLSQPMFFSLLYCSCVPKSATALPDGRCHCHFPQLWQFVKAECGRGKCPNGRSFLAEAWQWSLGRTWQHWNTVVYLCAGTVMGVFMICWMPFFVTNIISGICPTCIQVQY
jgi:hypothetical protein